MILKEIYHNLHQRKHRVHYLLYSGKYELTMCRENLLLNELDKIRIGMNKLLKIKLESKKNNPIRVTENEVLQQVQKESNLTFVRPIEIRIHTRQNNWLLNLIETNRKKAHTPFSLA